MTLPDRLDEIAGKLLATKDYSTFAHAIYQAAIELRSLQPEVPEGMVLVPAAKLTVGDCYRFGLDINSARDAAKPQLEEE